ncbi:peptidoglycan D,D-transpeptidase FtsI family protein [Streptomyces orinoci]|uniref:Penicillin-binding protein 2 n=1 Tax=Streptomyces orinoci TaxID=67339 RepID=A0ABV3JS68_STRON|nr:penicillin-binding protein 2 [Streptomyces orinoci]
MNKPVRHIAIFAGTLVLALLAQATWLQFGRADELAGHEKNRRVRINAYAHPRGNIIVGGEPVTGSVPTTGGDLKYKRSYTDGARYAPVTGFSSQTFGSNQLEYVYDKFLSGTDDRLFLQRTTDLFTGRKPRGGDVVTTIDPNAQQAAVKGLGKYKGAVVAIEPSTGRILALASTPSYDPSAIAGEGRQDQRTWQRLEADKDGKPLSNKAIKELYPAGSTFKILTAAAALDHGLYTDIDAPTDSPYPWNLPDTVTPMKNENESAPCRNASLKVAMQYSCNNVFAKIAAELGKDKMRETAEKFGFNQQVDMPVRVTGSVYPKDLNRPQTALTGIGQGSLAATPFQVAMMTAALANDGKLMKPHLVDKLRGPDLSTVQEFKPERMSQAVSPDTARKVQRMMEFTAKEGTGKAALIDGVTVGGKTGTAQHGANLEKIPYAWFVSYAKQDDGSPVAVAVFIDPEGSGVDRAHVSGGGLAGPIAKQVMRAVLKK